MATMANGRVSPELSQTFLSQRFSYFSQVRAQGPVEFGKKVFESSKLGKFDAI